MSASAAAARVKLLVLDVDGILTDGRLYYGNAGEELKSFNIKDGLGIKLLQRGGIEVAIITGRSSAIVERRAGELGIARVMQGREDKRVALGELCRQQGTALAQCAYMGDDLPDLGAIRAAGLGLTVADAVAEVRQAADWCSSLCGGAGAVREAAEFILQSQQKLQALLQEFA
jgi:3-deoxy-D-manno-octulosonate 8-phosphate phosphatase (KDO 8-P phosphatase)